VKNWTDLITGLAWPVVVGIALWRLMPAIRQVIASREFSIKVAGMEISAQKASETLGRGLEDLREQVSALKAQADSGTGVSPMSAGLPALRSVLWVDDYPENNAFEVDGLRHKGVEVVQVRSTAEALRLLDSREFSAVVTDMAREEAGGDNPRAGLDMISAVRERGLEVPMLVYASARAVARYGDEARGLGASVTTSSATVLLDALGRLGQT
jgi:CheY-like chemotaxis protein